MTIAFIKKVNIHLHKKSPYMKHIYTAIAALLVVATGFAQTDSTKKMSDTSGRQTDTIRVGNFIIIKKLYDVN